VKRVLFWGAVLIGGYIAVKNYKGFTADLNAGTKGASNIAKTLQGR
jgi:hypothetical protein